MKLFKKRNDEAIDTALASAAAVLAERDRITEAINRTTHEIATLEIELQRVLDAAAEVEVAATLAGEDGAAELATGEPRYGAIQDLQARLQVGEARLRALKRRLAENAARVLACQEPVRDAVHVWQQQHVEQHAIEFRRAADTFIAAVKKFAAIADGTGADYVGMRLREIAIPDPTDSSRQLFEPYPTRVQEYANGRAVEQLPAWSGDRQAEEIYTALATVRLKRDALDQLVEQIRRDRDAAARQEHAA